MRHTREAEFSERHIHFQLVLGLLRGGLDSTSKVRKVLVELLSSLSVFLLLLNLVLVSVSCPSLLSTRLIERHVRDLSVELDILLISTVQLCATYICLLLAENDRRSQMHVNKHDELLLTRLEEQVLDVAEEDVDL